MTRPKLVGIFKNGGESVWKIYHANAKEHPAIFKSGDVWHVGRAFFEGRRRNKIYIDVFEKKDFEIFDTTIHELMHVAVHDFGIDLMIEEAFVERVSGNLAAYLEQLKI
jgi:hypothetical protein